MRVLLFCIAFVSAASLNASAAEGHAATNAAALDLKKFQLAPGLKVELFASEPSLQNPVAFSIDGRGRFFVAETHRWNKSIFAQLIEVTPDKKVVWVLQDWKDINGVTAVQILDDPGIPEIPGQSEH